MSNQKQSNQQNAQTAAPQWNPDVQGKLGKILTSRMNMFKVTDAELKNSTGMPLYKIRAAKSTAYFALEPRAREMISSILEIPVEKLMEAEFQDCQARAAFRGYQHSRIKKEAKQKGIDEYDVDLMEGDGDDSFEDDGEE